MLLGQDDILDYVLARLIVQVLQLDLARQHLALGVSRVDIDLLLVADV